MVLSKIVAITTGALMFALLGRAGPAPIQKPDEVRVDRYGDPLPAGAVLRLGTVRYRPGWKSPFGSVAVPLFFASSQNVVAVRHNGHEVQLWNAETGKLLREISTGTLSINSFAVSTNGKFVAVSGLVPPVEERGKSVPAIGIWDLTSGNQVRLAHREVNGTTHSALALMPDGKLLVSLDKDAILRIEEVATGLEVRRHQLPRGNSDSLAVSADGSLIAISGGGPNRQLFVWNWQSDAKPRELAAPPDPSIMRFNSQFVAMSPSGRTLVEAGDTLAKAEKGMTSKATVRTWELASGQIVLKSAIPATSLTHSVVVSPDGKSLIASARNNTDAGGVIQIWDSTTGKTNRVHECQVGALAVSPDSRLLAGAGEGAIRVWDLATGKELSANQEAHFGNVTHVAAAGNLILSAGADHTVRLWDASTGKQRLKLTHGRRIRAAALSPDATRVVTSCMDDSVCLWDAVTGDQLYKLPGHGKTGMFRAAVGFAPDGKCFFSCADDLNLRKWETATGKPFVDYKLSPLGVKLPDDPRNPRNLLEMGLNYGTFSPDGSRYVLPVGGFLHVFDVETGKDVQQIRNLGNLGVSFSLAISPDGMLILQRGMNGGKSKNYPFTLYDLATGQPKLKLEFPLAPLHQHIGPVAFSPDGKLFAVVTDEPERQIRLYSMGDSKEAGVVQGFRGNVESLCFTADSMRLISGMADTTALVWDLKIALGRGKQ